MGARAEAEATRTVDATPDAVWAQIGDGRRVAGWWPLAERAEDVQGGRFTLVLRSSRGVPVRTDWRVVVSRRPERQRWEQDLAGTPFAATLRRSAVELRLEPADGGRCRVTVAVEREMTRGGLTARVFGRRAARRHAGDAAARLARAVAAAG